MIVTCTRCQAKFRVADDKVGPRGARARCARCQQVFVVRRVSQPHAPERTEPFAGVPTPAPPTASVALDLEPPSRGGPEVSPDDPFAAYHAAAARAAPGTADPFASFEPPASAAAGPEDGWPSDDPFAAASEPWPEPPAGASADPAAMAALAEAGDPFAASISPRAGVHAPTGSALPVTDLADLGGVAPARPPPLPPPLPPPGTAPAAPPGLDLAAALSAGPDLALEERTTRTPVAPRGAGDDFLGIEAGLSPLLDGAPAPGPSGPGVAHLTQAEEPLALATEAEHAPWPGAWSPGGGPAPEALPGVEHAAETPTAPAPSQRPAPHAPPAAPTERRLAPGGGALRRVLVNAVALAALLAVALAFRVLWGGGVGRGPSVIAALGGSAAREDVLVASGVTSGRYERASGPPLLFVRGEVTSHAAAPLTGVRVEVQVIRDGRVLAAGVARAGAVPTSEELHAVTDAAALDALAAAVARRVTGAVRPGEAVPFLVALADLPEDLSGASIRVVASPQPGGAR